MDRPIGCRICLFTSKRMPSSTSRLTETFLMRDSTSESPRTQTIESEMKIVFLDFDGVLNSHDFLHRWQENAAREAVEFKGNEHLMLDPVAVGRVNQILAASGAKVVISSSWRHGWTIERLKEILKAVGFVGEVIDYTPKHGKDRGHEIDEWLQDHDEGHDPFVILDDDSDMSHMTKHLVKTAFAHGILDIHVEEAIERLMGS